MNYFQLADVIGIIGVFIILAAYYLLNIGKMNALNIYYQLMNLVGSVLILFSLFYQWNLPAVIIEVSWIIVSFIGIFRILRLAGKLEDGDVN
ncbi:MAG: hypothetical protein H0W64_02060 [Gammaproteobacteria bacterium]|nr:hypothetical protein [Gammaproteobacteria bacterium]